MHAAEASPFETSEMLAGFLSSTPLLSESWGLCSLANVNSRSSNGFLTEQIGTTGYVAFSGVQFDSPGAGFPMTSDSTCRNLVPLDDVASCNSIFSPINGRYEGEEKPVMVHARSLWIFLSMCENPIFQSQVSPLPSPHTTMKISVFIYFSTSDWFGYICGFYNLFMYFLV
uniref:Uncharacterized protein n=1 Tax=Rhizophora mucronata TaxID=61149 RepID=A0A2P2KZ21_RHIMU